MQFLGYLVNQKGILAVPAKIEVVIQWEIPRSPIYISELPGSSGLLSEMYSGSWKWCDLLDWLVLTH